MTAFLVRRSIQILVVIILASIASYGLLYLAPGGPIQCPQDPRCKDMRQEDIERIKARFELDLILPVRFMRWFVGIPDGPLTIGDTTYFGDVQVGCARTDVVRLSYSDGSTEIVEECGKPVTLADLEERRESGGVLFFDFGLSQTIARDQPVGELIMSRLPFTLALMGFSTLITLLIAVPVGIYSAVHQYSRFDYAMTTTAFVGASLPTFFFGIILILVFAVLFKEWGLPYLPPGSAISNRDYVIPLLGDALQITVRAESFLDYVLHFIMPCAVLAFVSIAQWSRFIRASMLEVLQQDYVRTARAKGLRERVVVLKHSFRNAMIPFVTLLANTLPTLIAGAAITEAVFNWPGLGRLLIDALNRYDYAVAMALLYVTIALQLIGYLLSDILYTVVDPRIKLS